MISMNAAGIDYCCFGNHDADIPISQLYNRIRESKFSWINTNMQNLPLPADIPKLPDYCVIEIGNTEHKRRLIICKILFFKLF